MDEKRMNAARKRFDALLLTTMREQGCGGLSLFREDGKLWVTNGFMAVLYYEVDFYLNLSKFQENPRLGEFARRLNLFGMTAPAECRRQRRINGDAWVCEMDDGAENEIWIKQDYFKVFGGKFDFCITDRALSVFCDGELCGFILPINNNTNYNKNEEK